jgi:hypothetical protein
LETAALPTELHPCNSNPRLRPVYGTGIVLENRGKFNYRVFIPFVQ